MRPRNTARATGYCTQNPSSGKAPRFWAAPYFSTPVSGTISNWWTTFRWAAKPIWNEKRALKGFGIARATGELLGFKPWDRSENTQTTGQKPAPYQSERVYEAVGTIYEHGFAFIEAPTGSGKTDIGKHLGAVLPSMYEKIILQESSDASHRRRQGAFGLIPPAVIKNWDTQTGSNFPTISSSLLSRDDMKGSRKTRQAVRVAQTDGEIKRLFLNSAACIIDDSHRFASRWLSPSIRSRNLEESPSIWTACLSATLLGNRGLDGLMAFHEKRDSIYMSAD